jgi:hypothetical protein
MPTRRVRPWAVPILTLALGLFVGRVVLGGTTEVDTLGAGAQVTPSHPQTVRGAADAASAYTRLLSTEALQNPARARKIVQEVLTPDLAESAIPALEQSLKTIAAARGRGVAAEAMSSPLAADVLDYESGRASVRILSAVAVAAPTQPLQVRITEEVPELVWQDERWLIAGGDPARAVLELRGTRAQARTFLGTIRETAP